MIFPPFLSIYLKLFSLDHVLSSRFQLYQVSQMFKYGHLWDVWCPCYLREACCTKKRGGNFPKFHLDHQMWCSYIVQQRATSRDAVPLSTNQKFVVLGGWVVYKPFLVFVFSHANPQANQCDLWWITTVEWRGPLLEQYTFDWTNQEIPPKSV